MNTQEYIGIFVVHTCGNCGTTFGMDEGFYKARLRDRKSWWCPKGCQRHFIDESEEERLRRELRSQSAHTEYYREQYQRERASLISTRGHVTRLKRRVAVGRCPCCEKDFKNLARHMSSQHPEFVE